MKEYKQNMQSKDEMFEQRTAELKAKGASKQPADLADDLSQPDPWTASKLANTEVIPEGASEIINEETKEEVKEEETPQ